MMSCDCLINASYLNINSYNCCVVVFILYYCNTVLFYRSLLVDMI